MIRGSSSSRAGLPATTMMTRTRTMSSRSCVYCVMWRRWWSRTCGLERSNASYLHLSFCSLSPLTLNWEMPSINSANRYSIKYRHIRGKLLIASHHAHTLLYTGATPPEEAVNVMCLLPTTSLRSPHIRFSNGTCKNL